MGDISLHISRSEIACPCGCGFQTADHELVEGIEDLAAGFLKWNPNAVRVAAHFNSWCRCKAYDLQLKKDLAGKAGIKFVPKDKASEHLFGWATDFWMEYVYQTHREKIPDDEIADQIELDNPDRHGVGRYVGRTHWDVRPYAARWDNR